MVGVQIPRRFFELEDMCWVLGMGCFDDTFWTYLGFGVSNFQSFHIDTRY